MVTRPDLRRGVAVASVALLLTGCPGDQEVETEDPVVDPEGEPADPIDPIDPDDPEPDPAALGATS